MTSSPLRRPIPFAVLAAAALAVLPAGGALAGPAATAPAPEAANAAAPVRLAPHKAVYDLSLVASRGARNVESARGRIAFDFTGNACEGYALKFRQVTVIQAGEGAASTTDLRTTNFESGDGRSFRFRNETITGRGAPKVVDGSADRKAGSLLVKLRTPKRDSFETAGEVAFPNGQMRDLIVAARAGRTTVPLKVYDGSDDGRKVYDTLAIIGQNVTPKPGVAALEEAAQQPGLAGMARWPVTISYFAQGRGEQVPAYTLSFELYDNGVSRDLKLDYGDFALKGELKRLELLPDTGCGK